MKKSLVALAVLASIAGAAQAQSTVTLYGRLDQGLLRYNYNDKGASAATYQNITKNALVDGGFNGSRFGLRGTEDLGGGVQAVFNLEAGINADQGSSTQGSTLFGRRSVFGLQSATAGTVLIGRNSSPYDDIAADGAMMETSFFDPSITNNAPQGLVTNAVQTAKSMGDTLLTRGPGGNGNTAWIGYSTRFNNSLRYNTPTMGGFSASFMYAMGEDNKVGGTPAAPTTTDASATISAYAKYVGGPLMVSLGYQSEALGGTQATTASGLAGATTLVGANQITASNALVSQKPVLVNTHLGTSYDLGVVKLGAAVNRAEFKDVLFTDPVTGVTGAISAQNESSLSIAVPVGAATYSLGYAASTGDSLGKASGFGLQAKYALSKRTFAYGGYTKVTTYDRLKDAITAAGGQVQDVSSYGIGMQHQF